MVGLTGSQVRDGSLSGSSSNSATAPGDIALGSISTPDLRDQAVSRAKVEPTLLARIESLICRGRAQDLAQSSTTSTSMQTKLSTQATLEVGTYRLGWTNRYQCSSATQAVQIQIKHTLPNLTSVIEDSLASRTEASQNSSPSGAGFMYLTVAAAGLHKFEMQYCSSNKSATAYISDAVFELHKVIDL